VAVTNGDSVPHTRTLGAAFLRGGTIIGVGGGELRDLGVGQTATAAIGIVGSTEGAAQMLIVPDSILS
jgi:hypothetical protein